jgi:hypothetical protein
MPVNMHSFYWNAEVQELQISALVQTNKTGLLSDVKKSGEDKRK